MLIALLSDIHANAAALEACLAQCANLAIGQYVILGDLVGYGPEPETVTKRVQGLQSAGAVVLRGNHDHAVAAGDSGMNSTAAQAIAWTRTKLSADSKAYLAGLPLKAELEHCLFVHSDASAPAHWIYVVDSDSARTSLMATRAQVTFCGHVHVPATYCLSATGKLIGHVPASGVEVPLIAQRQWLAVMGAVGQPRDGNPAAAFATYDTKSRLLTYRRAPYDAESVAARIRQVGLPESLAIRLTKGK